MNVAVMQPYLFPYLGYFNLIHACDAFIFLDNVQHIPRGFVNRNRILMTGSAHMFTVPLAAAPRDKWINERHVGGNFHQFYNKFIATLEHAYSKAPHKHEILELVSQVLGCGEENLARLCDKSIRAVCRYLGLERTMLVASDMLTTDQARQLRGQDKIIRLAVMAEATRYLNPMGGIELYAPEDFANAGMELRFVQPTLPEYPQEDSTFIPGLSIIDVLMHVQPETVRHFLTAYVVLEKK